MTPSRLQPGDEVDAYRIVSVLHSGGMATLYRVEREGSELPLAMKVPRLAQGDDPVTVVSYEVEQMMLAALHGPHVPRLDAVGDLERQPYLVMELIAGDSLQTLAGQAPLPIDDVARLGAAVAEALANLHAQHLAHLDVKPSNIMFRASGEAVLIDLGLAHHSHYPDLLAEEFHKPIGSAPYMAPEQVLGLRSDPRSDIFALGAMLYQLTTGAMPFGSPTSIGGLRQRLHRYPRAPRALREEIPEWLQEVILQCLEVDAARRPSAHQVAAWLRRPESVVVGVRGRRTRDAGWLTRLRRWIWAAGFEPATPEAIPESAAAVPIVLVAVATRHRDPSMHEALQAAVRDVAAIRSEARIAVATVIPPQPLLGGSGAESGGNLHLRQLVELHEWATALKLPDQRLTFHVLEAGDPAQALLDYAANNSVQQLIIGAPPLDGNPKLGIPYQPVVEAVASRVALLAPCTVVLVRAATRA